MTELALYLILGLAAIIGVVLVAATRRPDTFEVARSTTINAAPAAIFPLIDNLRSMNGWIPFLEPDPHAEIGYSGPANGPGAKSWWKGNRKVGEGDIEIVESVAPSKVALKLNMVKPMKALNDVVFRLEPVASGTRVTWSLSGPQSLLGKVMTLFINCDDMAGSQFEKGLAKLKALSES